MYFTRYEKNNGQMKRAIYYLWNFSRKYVIIERNKRWRKEHGRKLIWMP